MRVPSTVVDESTFLALDRGVVVPCPCAWVGELAMLTWWMARTIR